MRTSLFAALGLSLLSTAARADEVPVDKLLIEVKQALLEVQQDANFKELPALQSVELHLITEQKVNASGGFDLFIVDFSKSYTRDSTTEVTLTLIPPPANAPSHVSNPQIAELLKNSIIASTGAVKAASSGPPPLIVGSLKTSIKFQITQDTGGKLKIAFLPLTLNGGADGTTAATQEIIVTYGKLPK